MISCKLISTKEILALKKKMAYNAEKKKTNKQTNKTNTGKSYKKFYLQRFGKKRILPKPNHPYPPPPPLPPLKSQMVDPYSVRIQVMCKLSNKKNKTSCGEKQQQQPELPKGDVYVNRRKSPYLPRVYCRVTLCGISAVPKNNAARNLSKCSNRRRQGSDLHES